MKVFYSDTFELLLPAGHRFPMAKYRLLRERVASSGIAELELCIPEPASNEVLLRVHERDYVDRVTSGQMSDLEMRRIGFPWSPRMVERSRRSVGASIDAARCALKEGVSVNLAGGTHHAFPDAGQGYCVFNDVCVAARAMQQQGLCRRVLFVDLDVHQGNGTAAIARGDESLFAFSIHCEKNFPFRKETGDFDVALPRGTGDAHYLEVLGSSLAAIAEQFDPCLVFFLAGADPWEGDRLGLLKLTKAGLAERDRMVFDWCGRRGLPCAVSMAGGYAPDVMDIVDIHFRTVLQALELHRRHPRIEQAIAATGGRAPIR